MKKKKARASCKKHNKNEQNRMEQVLPPTMSINDLQQQQQQRLYSSFMCCSVVRITVSIERPNDRLLHRIEITDN